MIVRDRNLGMFNIQKMLNHLKKASLSVGIFSDAVNREGKTNAYVADYAITNEYGSENIPERSFMRSTIDEKQEEWSKLMEVTLLGAVQNKENYQQNIDKELYKIGAIARRDIIAKIDSNINPPNSPSTIKRKGNRKNKTLIDDGVLRSSIEARIGEK